MNDILSLLTLFGERYINCDTDQAIVDAMHNRDSMVEAYNAILHMAALAAEGGDS